MHILEQACLLRLCEHISPFESLTIAVSRDHSGVCFDFAASSVAPGPSNGAIAILYALRWKLGVTFTVLDN